MAIDNDVDWSSQTADPGMIDAGIMHVRQALDSRDVSVSPLIGNILIDVLKAERAWCVLYDKKTNEFLYQNQKSELIRMRPERGALLDYIASSGETTTVDVLSQDPRYRPHIDNPESLGEERFIAQCMSDSQRHFLGLLIAVRNKEGPPFGEGERLAIGEVAKGLMLPAVLATADLNATATDELTALPPGVGSSQGVRPDLFRKEAIAYYLQGYRSEGSVIRMGRNWEMLASLCIIFAILASGCFLLFVRHILAPK